MGMAATRWLTLDQDGFAQNESMHRKHKSRKINFSLLVLGNNAFESYMPSLSRDQQNIRGRFVLAILNDATQFLGRDSSGDVSC